MIEINNLTNIKVDKIFVKNVLREVLRREKGKGNVSVAFVDSNRIKELNNKYRQKNKATNVLSFEGIQGLGEIIICPEKIGKSNIKTNILFKKELAKVLIHGILHLLGYDHESGKSNGEIERMRKKEEYYFNKSKKLI